MPFGKSQRVIFGRIQRAKFGIFKWSCVGIVVVPLIWDVKIERSELELLVVEGVPTKSQDLGDFT